MIATTMIADAPKTVETVNYLVELLKPTTLIAFIIAIVAVQQWLTNRRRLKLDLFDRRFKVYDGVLKFMQQKTEGGVPDHEVENFIWDISTAKFLFKDDANEFISKVINTRFDPDNPEKTSEWFHRASDMFKKYMDFSKL